MAAIRIYRKLRELLDVAISSPADGDVLSYNATDSKWENSAAAGGGAPTNVDYLVGTANGSLSAEIVVGTSPGGELGGTWASPTVDTTHSGSSHASVQAAAEATAAAALSAHAADTTGVHGIADTSVLETSAGAQSKADAAAAAAEAYADSAVATHSADTTSVHGITDTSTLYRSGGTDVAVADGGTGSSTASGARTNLGLVIGTDVEAHDADLTTIAGLSPTNDDVLQRKAGAWANRSLAQLMTDLAALGTTFQPLDSDLTSIAALTTTSYGRALLTLANAGAADWITNALIDAKGDLIVGTADNTPARLAVGSDGNVLTADAASAGGVKWAAAAGGGGGLTLLGSHVITSGTSSTLTVTSIAGTSNNMLILIYARTNESGANRSPCGLTFNSGGSYHDQYNYAGATSGATDETSSGRVARIEVPGATGSAGSFGQARIDVPRYADTTGWKGAIWQMQLFGGSSDVYVYNGGGVWASTAAITSVTLTPFNTAAFIAGSAMYVYGL